MLALSLREAEGRAGDFSESSTSSVYEEEGDEAG